MPKPPVASGNEVARALERAGFVRLRVVGSHATYDHAGRKRRTVVPLGSKDLKIGALRKILDQAGLTAEDLRSLLL